MAISSAPLEAVLTLDDSKEKEKQAKFVSVSLREAIAMTSITPAVYYYDLIVIA